jgi:hypothetical protein
VVYFELRTPTEYEKTHLPVILITSDTWNPSDEVLRPKSNNREINEMLTIRSLTSGMTKWQIESLTKEQSNMQIEKNGEVKNQLRDISCVYNTKEFCERLISTVNIATVHRDDLDQPEGKARVSSIMSNNRHSKVTPEEIARKWNIGINTAKDTIRVMTQRGIRTAVHPMTR